VKEEVDASTVNRLSSAVLILLYKFPFADPVLKLPIIMVGEMLSEKLLVPKSIPISRGHSLGADPEISPERVTVSRVGESITIFAITAASDSAETHPIASRVAPRRRIGLNVCLIITGCLVGFVPQTGQPEFPSYPWEQRKYGGRGSQDVFQKISCSKLMPVSRRVTCSPSKESQP
jgi:hypothetical protein